jgi:hypothetical protein
VNKAILSRQRFYFGTADDKDSASYRIKKYLELNEGMKFVSIEHFSYGVDSDGNVVTDNSIEQPYNGYDLWYELNPEWTKDESH